MADQWDPLRTVVRRYAKQNGLWNDGEDKPHTSKLARRLGMSQPALSQFLKGDKGGSLAIVARVARVLGVPMETLLPAELVLTLPQGPHDAETTPGLQTGVALSDSELQARERLRELGQTILLAVGRSETFARRETGPPEGHRPQPARGGRKPR